ncbi:MAG: 50S ribosomal protein L10 [Proteobacteria bacterium]|nr:50S ribosomal protein L10 [Pseudomonadota bacterium]
MAMNLQQKEVMTGELVEKFKNSQLAVLVGYQGITCAEIVSLRKKLKPSGAKFAVVKNTLARRAVKDTAADKLGDFFVGPTAVIWSDKDPVSPAKVIKEFAKENDKFQVKAGVLDDTILDAKGVDSLASLPSREELLGKLLGLLNAPATKLLQTLNAPASQVVRLLAAWRDEVEKKQS